MRNANVFSLQAMMPRMSWSAKNLYNLIARASPFHSRYLNYRTTMLTMYQQRYRAKRFLRGYHGDWIPEKRFKRWFLPVDLPRFQPPQVSTANVSGSSTGPKQDGVFNMALKARRSNSSPTSANPAVKEMEPIPSASLFMRDVERRLDVVVFRCCFARSAYEARSLVVHGKVQLNGTKVTDPNVQLNPGDLISVEPEAIPMLSDQLNSKAKPSATESTETEPEQTESTEQTATTESDSSSSKDLSEPSNQQDSSSSTSSSSSSKSKSKPFSKTEKLLAPGVRPFTLPPFASPFLFIPPYLELSFTTCSAIYLRHPTIVPYKLTNSNGTTGWSFKTDLPSPYPAGGELYSMAWEHYVKNSPRIRSDVRRIKHEAKLGRNGFVSSRAKDLDSKRIALRKGYGRTKPVRGWRMNLVSARSSVSSKASSSVTVV